VIPKNTSLRIPSASMNPTILMLLGKTSASKSATKLSSTMSAVHASKVK